jgi:O-antigen/teichoic acid export membrane protein
MRRHILALGQQTLIYGLSGVALQILGVVTVPIFARVFSPSEYGVFELLTVAIAAVGILVDLGMASASQRSYFDYSDEQHAERRVVLSTAMLTSVGSATVLAAVLIVFRGPIASFMFDGRHYSKLVVVAAIALPLTAAATFTREIMRLRFRAWHYFASSVITALAGNGYVIVALLAFHAGLTAAVLGGAISGALALLYGGFVVRNDVGRRYSTAHLRTMLAYGLPLVPTAAALWALALIDRILLAKLSTLSQVGEYAVANRLGMVLALVTTAFAVAYAPFMLSMFEQDPEEEKVVRGKTLTYVTVVLALVAVIVGLFAREILMVAAPAYRSAYEAVGMLAIGTAAYGISTVALGGIALARQTSSLVALAAAAAVVNVALNLALIPIWGMNGSAAATAVGYVVLLALYYWRAQRVYPTPYEPGRVLRVLVAMALPLAVGAIPLSPLWVALVVKAGVLLAFAGALVLLGVIDRAEIAALRSLMAERLRSVTA